MYVHITLGYLQESRVLHAYQDILIRVCEEGIPAEFCGDILLYAATEFERYISEKADQQRNIAEAPVIIAEDDCDVIEDEYAAAVPHRS